MIDLTVIQKLTRLSSIGTQALPQRHSFITSCRDISKMDSSAVRFCNQTVTRKRVGMRPTEKISTIKFPHTKIYIQKSLTFSAFNSMTRG